MKAKEKVKKQKYSKEERDVDNIFRKKGESTADALKRIITREHQRIVEKGKKNLTADPAKVVPIEKKEEIQVKGKGDERKYIDNSCGREREIEHYAMDLIDFLQGILSRFEDLFDVGMNADDQNKDALVNTGIILVNDANREVEEFCDMIKKRIGAIEIDYEMGKSSNKKLGVVMIPVQKEPVEQAKEA
jgi:hypothetical protein